jgi:hypothetical protein
LSSPSRSARRCAAPYALSRKKPGAEKEWGFVDDAAPYWGLGPDRVTGIRPIMNTLRSMLLAAFVLKRFGRRHLPPSLPRLSVGIEDDEDLWADLDSAMRSAATRRPAARKILK